MHSLSALLDTFGGEPIPNCPGRYVLRRVKSTDGPQAIVASRAASTEHHVRGARDTVVVTWFDGWGLISYARADGTWLHTANDSDGFRRKLADLGIPLVRREDVSDLRLPTAEGPVASAGASLAGQFGMLWGVAGVSLLLLSAVVRLGAVALETLRMDLDTRHWVACAISLVFIGISEGYMAFQRGYSPRVAARALHLKDNPQLWNVALAPVFCMGLIHATRRRLISSWIVVVGVVLIIIAVRALPPLWRGIVDLGVTVALGWGVAAVWYYFGLGLRGTELPVSADTPGS